MIEHIDRNLGVMRDACKIVGKNRCLRVHYEQLILHPESILKHVVKFLNITWTDRFLNHEDYIGELGISDVECSTWQVKKPINMDSLIAWWGSIPKEVQRNIASIAPNGPLIKIFKNKTYNLTKLSENLTL